MRVPTALALSVWRQLLQFSRWLLLNSILSFVHGRAHAFVIGRFAGAHPLGLFDMALEVASLPATEMVAPVRAALLPGWRSGRPTCTSARRLCHHVRIIVMVACRLPSLSASWRTRWFGSRWGAMAGRHSGSQGARDLWRHQRMCGQYLAWSSSRLADLGQHRADRPRRPPAGAASVLERTRRGHRWRGLVYGGGCSRSSRRQPEHCRFVYWLCRRASVVAGMAYFVATGGREHCDAQAKPDGRFDTHADWLALLLLCLAFGALAYVATLWLLWLAGRARNDDPEPEAIRMPGSQAWTRPARRMTISVGHAIRFRTGEQYCLNSRTSRGHSVLVTGFGTEAFVDWEADGKLYQMPL